MTPDGDGLQARQETEDGAVLYHTPCGAVYTIAKPGYEPRYPNIKTKMAARKAKIPVFSAADAGASAVANQITCLGYAEPPKRSAGVKIQEKENAEAVRKAMELLLQDKVL